MVEVIFPPLSHEYLEERRRELRDDPKAFQRMYMQEPKIEPWQKDAVKTIMGWDLASPDGEYTVRWNSRIGRYERKAARGGKWEIIG